MEFDNPVIAYVFIIPFINILPKIAFKTILVDATYNTNKLKYKLYTLMASINRTGFLISYLYILYRKNYNIRIIITKWFKTIYDLGIRNVETLLSDKDFSQISSAQSVW